MDTSAGLTPTTAADQPRLARDDVPSIVAPSPWIAVAALAFGLGFDALHAFSIFKYAPALVCNIAALILIAIGGWHIVRAAAVFHRSATPFQRWRPARVIAAQGIYAHIRNPVCQGLLILVLGIAVLLRSEGSVLMLMPAAMIMHYGVVLREESYLERRFGDAYREYLAAVPRYGWRFRR
jgi:protein-S-isoprenylcysteine O-methyltransferase Ste14